MKHYKVITKTEFYRLGGFANPGLSRITRSGKWVYTQLVN